MVNATPRCPDAANLVLKPTTASWKRVAADIESTRHEAKGYFAELDPVAVRKRLRLGAIRKRTAVDEDRIRC